jgi:hypothetical protein
LIIALAILALVLGLANLGRTVMAVQYADRMPDLPMSVPWSYLAATGLLWGVAYTAAAVGLFLLRPWGRHVTLLVSTLQQVHSWINRLLFDASDYAHQTRARDLILTLIFMAVVWGTLNWGAVRRAFHPQKGPQGRAGARSDRMVD